MMASTNNFTRTNNGATTLKSSKDSNLDLFYQAGGIRGNNFYGDIPTDLTPLFSRAYFENSNVALRNLLNIRDIRHKGKGERDLFIQLLANLYTIDSQVFERFINSGIVEEIGRWDDLIKVLSMPDYKGHKKERNYIIQDYLIKQINKLYYSDTPNSLLPKWLPTNTRNKNTYEVIMPIISSHKTPFNKFSDYRKWVSAYRKSYNLLETNLTNKTYDKIDISKLPSGAFKKSQQALWRIDEAKMKQFLDDVDKGKSKVKTTGITVDTVLSAVDRSVELNNGKEVPGYQAIFNQMVKDTPDTGNTLVVADVSGSMVGKPMGVSVGLALLFAQANKGIYHNKFMTFSHTPELMNLDGIEGLYNQLNYIRSSEWGFNTDIDAAFKLVLDTAVNSKASQEDLPKRLLIISDMQFDVCVNLENPLDTTFKHWEDEFNSHGYQLPQIVFWNVSTSEGIPAESNQEGVALISGFTQGTLDAVIKAEKFTPNDVMLNALMRPEYDVVNTII